jgi:hypothetical protein
MQQPTSNKLWNSKGSKEKGKAKEETQQCMMQQPTNDGAGKGRGNKEVASCMRKKS